jgi:hypothetical protein
MEDTMPENTIPKMSEAVSAETMTKALAVAERFHVAMVELFMLAASIDNPQAPVAERIVMTSSVYQMLYMAGQAGEMLFDVGFESVPGDERQRVREQLRDEMKVRLEALRKDITP